MELLLIRAQFPKTMMGQLYLNNKLLCICVDLKYKKKLTLLSHLPDGRYSLKLPEEDMKEWNVKITHCKSRKYFFIKQGPATDGDPVSYDHEIPLYISWTQGFNNITELALKNIKRITDAIDKKEKVYLTISSQTMDMMD